MTKFRLHRGDLGESLATVVEIQTFSDLVAQVARHCSDFGWGGVTAETVTVKPYGFDARINWDTHMVCLSGNAVGFTDGPI